MLRTIAGAVLSWIGGGVAWVMASSTVAEKLIAAIFRQCGQWPIVSSLARRTFSAFQVRVARSGDSLRVTTLRRGTRMMIELQDYSAFLYFNPVALEPRTIRFIVEHLRDGDVFVDIGANIGYFTLIAASVLREKGGGQVFAFEPNPAVYRLLTDSVRLSHLENIVTAFPWALSRGDSKGALLYLATSSNTGLSSLKPWEPHLKSGALSGTRTINVECRDLDALFREGHLRRADFIKIDVEAAELDVLAGSELILDHLRPRYIVCETDLDSEAAQFLRGRGYVASMLESLNPNYPTWGNILFTAPGIAV